MAYRKKRRSYSGRRRRRSGMKRPKNIYKNKLDRRY